jgi:outer membrane murein-binding lipoprotein Lpp
MLQGQHDLRQEVERLQSELAAANAVIKQAKDKEEQAKEEEDKAKGGLEAACACRLHVGPR